MRGFFSTMVLRFRLTLASWPRQAHILLVKTRPNTKRPSSHRSPARFIARVLPGAKPAAYPGFVKPCLATLHNSVPAGGRWTYEIKFDGYRVQAHLKGGSPTLYTRAGHNWTPRFANIAQAVSGLPANDVILDGEVIVQRPDGASDFSLLQADLAAGRSNRLIYYVFDLLYLDGFDIRAAPLSERRRVLSEFLGPAPTPPIAISSYIERDGAALFEQATAMGLEGIVSKLRDAPYRSGRSESWLKIKSIKRGTFHIVGFDPDRTAIAALYLGRREGKRLVYMGKVGTGFARKTAVELRQMLDQISVTKAPLTVPIKTPKAVWVRPVHEADIEYRDITAEGLLRAASYKGLARYGSLAS